MLFFSFLIVAWGVTYSALQVARADGIVGLESAADIEWVNASHSFLQQVYTKHDYCVLMFCILHSP